jgi:hypothetical protein
MRAPLWTEAELARIRDLRAKGVRYSEVMGYVALFPGRKPYALRQQYAVLFSTTGKRPRRNQRRTESTRDLKRILKARAVADVIADHNVLLAHERPITRADCLTGGVNAARPCPFVSCKHHLYLEVREKTGALTFPHAAREPWQLAETCAADIADRSRDRRMASDAEHALEEIGTALNLTRERVRQLVASAVTNAVESLSPRDAQRVRDALASLDDRDPDAHVATGSTLDLPRVVRHLPVVQDRPPPVRAVLDPETRALAATFASLTSPRTWLRRAAAKRSP